MGRLLNNFLRKSSKTDKFLEKWGKHWKNKGKNIDIKEIYYDLCCCGCYHAEKVVKSEKYLDRYLQLKKQKISDIEISYILIKEIDGK
ncbi:MAG: hypothetical protein MUP30_11760 [Deltaproteobacteria bacterium]|nr:hypothetical protein [Deltaproteobacteria bacterium]